MRSKKQQPTYNTPTACHRPKRARKNAEHLQDIQGTLDTSLLFLHMIRDADDVVHTSVSASVTTRKEKAETIEPSSQQRAKNNINSLKTLSLKFLQKEARASFRHFEIVHKHKCTFETRHPFQKSTRCTHYDKIERKDTNRAAQSTKTCHASFSLVVSSHQRHKQNEGQPTFRKRHSTSKLQQKSKDPDKLGLVAHVPSSFTFSHQNPLLFVTARPW